MNIIYVILTLLVVAGVIVAIRYFISDTDPDDDIKKNNSNRMLSQYKSKK